MKKTLILLLAILLLSSCGFVDDMQDMLEKQQRLSDKIKRDFGWDANIGWNISNGTLTQVTISFSPDDIAQEKVGELKAKIDKLVAQSFEQKPQALIIQIIAIQS